jgi:taurine dioxygenase
VSVEIIPTDQACGAEIRGIDLTRPLSDSERESCISALLTHKVIFFADQNLDEDGLERASLQFGPFGDDPFIAPIEGREHIIAVRRKANEKAPIFAENWHTDWSFQEQPPAATCLFGITVPPSGGDTWYADQMAAAKTLPAELRRAITGRQGIHSAKLPYAPEGAYGDADRATDRSMDIRADRSAEATMLHPLLSPHPESGLERIYGCVGYLIGIEGIPDDEALGILLALLEHQTQPEFVYQHQWKPKMLTLWDNRAVLHRATGGYEGHDRLLHRTTIRSLA